LKLLPLLSTRLHPKSLAAFTSRLRKETPESRIQDRTLPIYLNVESTRRLY
jgi:hypothetical protein